MFIDDLLGVVQFLIANDLNNIKLINVGSQTETPISVLAKKIAEKLQIDKALNPLASWPGSVQRRLPDTSLLRSVYSFKETSLDEGLNKTLSWYLKK
jgi:nucleoside-diphosphate-sugar epimerase